MLDRRVGTGGTGGAGSVGGSLSSPSFSSLTLWLLGGLAGTGGGGGERRRGLGETALRKLWLWVRERWSLGGSEGGLTSPREARLKIDKITTLRMFEQAGDFIIPKESYGSIYG